AAALGNDPNFATTMTNALAGKMDKAANGKDIADVSEFLKNLGFGERLLEADGYFELPGGLLLQWGHGSVHATNAKVSFKKPF
ncbi:phage tail protein, partial [Enterobacter roggenkampii]|nr:phage tail protein [Enterobacter roggenkampii]